MAKIGTALLCALALAISPPAAAAGFKQENKPENLRDLFKNIHQAMYDKKDTKGAADLMQSVIPDEARVKKALKDNVPTDMLQRIVALHKKMGPMTERDLVMLVKPQQQNVQVHAAKTEDIIQSRDGSVAFKEFPGGSKRVAEQVLRPRMTFYEVELLEPGKNSGTKLHLFYWDGKQWSMLGPVWRVLEAK